MLISLIALRVLKGLIHNNPSQVMHVIVHQLLLQRSRHTRGRLRLISLKSMD